MREQEKGAKREGGGEKDGTDGWGERETRRGGQSL